MIREFQFNGKGVLYREVERTYKIQKMDFSTGRGDILIKDKTLLKKGVSREEAFNMLGRCSGCGRLRHECSCREENRRDGLHPAVLSLDNAPRRREKVQFQSRGRIRRKTLHP